MLHLHLRSDVRRGIPSPGLAATVMVGGAESASAILRLSTQEQVEGIAYLDHLVLFKLPEE